MSSITSILQPSPQRNVVVEMHFNFPSHSHGCQAGKENICSIPAKWPLRKELTHWHAPPLSIPETPEDIKHQLDQIHLEQPQGQEGGLNVENNRAAVSFLSVGDNGPSTPRGSPPVNPGPFGSPILSAPVLEGDVGPATPRGSRSLDARAFGSPVLPLLDASATPLQVCNGKASLHASRKQPQAEEMSKRFKSDLSNIFAWNATSYTACKAMDFEPAYPKQPEGHEDKKFTHKSSSIFEWNPTTAKDPSVSCKGIGYDPAPKSDHLSKGAATSDGISSSFKSPSIQGSSSDFSFGTSLPRDNGCFPLCIKLPQPNVAVDIESNGLQSPLSTPTSNLSTTDVAVITQTLSTLPLGLPTDSQRKDASSVLPAGPVLPASPVLPAGLPGSGVSTSPPGDVLGKGDSPGLPADNQSKCVASGQMMGFAGPFRRSSFVKLSQPGKWQLNRGNLVASAAPLPADDAQGSRKRLQPASSDESPPKVPKLCWEFKGLGAPSVLPKENLF
eukprot:jgi/Botrbrau1/16770/Bobra.150_2s0005.1